MLTFLLVAGLAVALALLVAVHYRLGDLPADVWSLARRERAEDAPRAIDAMKEAVAAKAGAAVLALQRYEDNLAASFRAQVADAEMRARMSEMRAADSVTALQAATALVRELRSALETAKEPPVTRILPPSTPPAGDAERDTMEITKPSAGGLPKESRSGGHGGAS